MTGRFATGLVVLLATGAALAEEATVPDQVLVRRAPDVQQRRDAALRLGAVRDGATAPALVAALEDPDGEVRGLAARALGRIGDPAPVAAVAELLADPSPFARTEARTAVVALVATEGALARLTKGFATLDGSVRTVLVGVFAETNDPQALGALGVALGDTDAGVRAAAEVALRLVAEEKAAVALKAALQTTDDRTRIGAAQIAEERRVEAVAQPLALIAAEEAEPTEVRAATRRAAIALRDALDPPALATAARSAKERSVRLEALSVLTLFRDERAYVALVHGLGDGDEVVRARAASLLGEQGDARAVGPLAKAAGEGRNARIRKTIERAIDRLTR